MSRERRDSSHFKSRLDFLRHDRHAREVDREVENVVGGKKKNTTEIIMNETLHNRRLDV